MPVPQYQVVNGVSQTFNFAPGRAEVTEEIDAYGSSQVAVNVASPAFPVNVASPVFPVTVALNLADGAEVTAAFQMQGASVLDVGGGATSALLDNAANTLADTHAVIQPAVLGAGSFTLTGSGSLEFGGAVASGITVNLDRASGSPASLTLDHPDTFGGLVNFADAAITLAGLSEATGYYLADGVLSIFGGPGDQAIDTLRLNDGSPEAAGLTLSLDGQGNVLIAEQGMGTAGGTALAPHAPPATPPAVLPPPVAIIDGLTGQPVTAFALQPYDGPVAGVQQQVVADTAGRLNIFANVPNLFIRTGSGDDAVQVNGGINVVDGGTGSNFLTSGTGRDTFFVDARGAASDTWSTVANFHSGDAVTLWGPVPPGPLSWFSGDGAAGAKGLTLRERINGNPHQASLTLAGFTNADLRNGRLTVSTGHDAASGSDYVYVQAN